MRGFKATARRAWRVADATLPFHIARKALLSGHLHTDLGTAAALCGALLAVIVLVLRALFGTGAAGIRANAAHLLRLLALKA